MLALSQARRAFALAHSTAHTTRTHKKRKKDTNTVKGEMGKCGSLLEREIEPGIQFQIGVSARNAGNTVSLKYLRRISGRQHGFK